MNTTKPRDTTYAYYQILALLVIILMVYGVGSMGVLWMRQQMASTAEATQRTQREIVQVERRIRYLDTKIAEIHQPSYLRGRLAALGLQLRPPADGQVVYMPAMRWRVQQPQNTESAERMLAERDPFRHSFDIAVMEPVRTFN